MERVVEAAHWFSRQPNIANTRDQRLEHGLGFHPRDHLAKALVDAKAKADMAAGRAGDVEIPGARPMARVAVGGGEEQDDL